MKYRLFSLLFIVSAFAFTACEKQGPSKQSINAIFIGAHHDVAKDLFAQSQKAGVDIDTSNLYVVSRNDAAFALASRTGLEDTPVPQMLNGGILGFGYLDVPDTKIEKGYYSFRVNAREDIRQDDTIAVAVELIDISGKVAGRFAGTAAIFALELPPPLRTVVISGGISAGIIGTRGNKKPTEKRYMYYCCKNGGVVCYDLDSPLPPKE